MKKQFEMPIVNIQIFMTENVITTSGVGGSNAENMGNKMTSEGYTVTAKSLGNFFNN